jgi:gliding motility-associated-like protein
MAPVSNFTTSFDTIYKNQVVDFIDNSIDASKWYWMFSTSSVDTAIIQNPKKAFDSIGIFPITLIVTDNNGCRDTLVKNIEIYPTLIGVPEAFTPNGDGINDVLYVKGGPFKDLEFKIYNQWGNEIFKSVNQSIGWNGTYEELLQPPGLYIFTVKASSLGDEKINFSGEINLLH